MVLLSVKKSIFHPKSITYYLTIYQEKKFMLEILCQLPQKRHSSKLEFSVQWDMISLQAVIVICCASLALLEPTSEFPFGILIFLFIPRRNHDTAGRDFRGMQRLSSPSHRNRIAHASAVALPRLDGPGGRVRRGWNRSQGSVLAR